MPTYEYRCKDCGEHLEIVQSFRDDALTECPQCGGQLKKVFGNIGIVLKGSGFYKTDSRPAAATSGRTDSGSSEGSKTSEAGKSDSGSSPKPDAKPSGDKPAADAKPAASSSSSSSAAS